MWVFITSLRTKPPYHSHIDLDNRDKSKNCNVCDRGYPADALKNDINLFIYDNNYQFLRSRSSDASHKIYINLLLTMKVSQWTGDISCSYRKKLDFYSTAQLHRQRRQRSKVGCRWSLGDGQWSSTCCWSSHAYHRVCIWMTYHRIHLFVS